MSRNWRNLEPTGVQRSKHLALKADGTGDPLGLPVPAEKMPLMDDEGST